MKIIIQQGQRKRELTGAFNICAGRADLEHLIEQIQFVLNRQDQDDFRYGWVHICEAEPFGPPNSRAEPWEAAE